MTETIEKLKLLFSLSAQPVLGCEGDIVVFANPAAVSFLKGDPTGRRAAELLPAHIIYEESESYISSGTLGDAPASIAVTRFDGVTVYSFTLSAETPSPAYIVPVISALRSSAFTIRLAADQLTEKLGVQEDERIDAYISSLYRSYFSILRLIVNLDTAGRLTDGTMIFSPRVCNITSLIYDLVSSLTHFLSDEDAEITFTSREPRVLGSVDSSALEQLLLNLLSNSVRHTKKGGRINITLHDSDDRIIISVDDNGCGVPTEVLGSVFSRYSQRRYLADMSGGLGLGLGIARGIAELHGGALIIESRLGEGTSVRVMLPKNLDTIPGIREPAPISERDVSVILREMSGIIGGHFYTKKYLD